MSGHGEKKSRKADVFIEAMLIHKTVADAATAAGISIASAHRWLRDSTVVERLRQARREAWGRAMSQLQEAGPEAVAALRKILNEAEGESPRVAACRVVLELGLRVIELESIEERLGKLEQIAKSHWKGANDDAANRTQAGPAGKVNGRAL